MNKLLSSVGLAITIATVSLLAGCQLYFGNGNSSGSGSNGPSGGGGPGSPPGLACSADKQCAAGCFCADGVCTEAGFCGTDKECGTGFHCDTSRSSCVPNPVCTTNDQCAPGSTCDVATGGGCVATCKCKSDAEAVMQGAGWCDEPRSTCMPGTDPAGTCTAVISCSANPPVCPENQVPLVKDGCFTGACRAITVCEAAPACPALQHDDDCTARTDCAPVTEGTDCFRPDGTVCHSGDTNCTCLTNTFVRCKVAMP